jgi:hypothetical protein
MGWALKIETFLGPEMAISEASAIWVQKSSKTVGEAGGGGLSLPPPHPYSQLYRTI